MQGHGEPLDVPPYALGGSEEPEVARTCLIDQEAKPWRIGLTIGNEIWGHRIESINNPYLAPAKLRNCAIGPELIIGLANVN